MISRYYFSKNLTYTTKIYNNATMTQNKTLSTRVSTEIYKLFTEQCDEDSISVSQCLKQMITDLSLGRKEYEDSSQCSIDNKVEKTTTTTPTFSQKSKFEKELDYLQNENILEKVKQRMEIGFAEYIDQLKTEVRKLETKIAEKQNKPMSCFTEEDRINSSFDV